MLKKAGVTTFAITDHNTVEGNAEAAAYAREHGLTHINGIELSCCFANGEIGLDESWVAHILGLGIDLDLMNEKYHTLQQEKQTHLLQLFNRLVADGYDIKLKKGTLKSKIFTRKNISNALIGAGYASDVDDCYEKILNAERYRPYAKNKPTIQEGIGIIQSCGGLAVWAHPFGVIRGGKKKLTQEQVYALSEKMREYGIDGMEVYYQKYSAEQISWLGSLADTFGLHKSIGTDLHNPKQLAFDIVEPDAGVEATLKKIMRSPTL